MGGGGGGGMFVDILRYSNREAYRFERIVQKLEKHRQGESFVITEEDEHDPRRCPKCSMMLDNPGDACSYCIRRGAGSVNTSGARATRAARWAPAECPTTTTGEPSTPSACRTPAA